MLVQLRRVVYLLVLLQCSLSVCLATTGRSHGPGSTASINMAEIKLRESIRRADVLIAKRPVCVKEGKKSMDDYEEKVKVALDAKKVLETHVEEMNKTARSITGVEVDKEKLAALKKQLEKVKPILMNAGKAVREAMTSLEWVGYVRNTCGGLSVSMEKEEGNLRKAVDAFRGFYPEVNKSDEMKRLEGEGDKIIWDLGEEKEEIKKYESNFKKNLIVDRDLVEMGRAVMKARAYYLGFYGVITEMNVESDFRETETVKKEAFEKKVERVEKNVTVEAENAKPVFDAEMERKIKAALKVKEGSMSNGIEEGVARRVEERKKADVAENARNAEEGEKGAKKGKERARRAADDETRGSQESEEPRGIKGKEEAKDLAVGKEGKAREQLGTIELHIDGSSSPALLHVPLLFLTLMCVLGSILVC